MTLPVFQNVITDDDGNILPNAQLEIRREIDDGPVSIYEDRNANDLLSAVGDAEADIEGFIRFYAWPDVYKISITASGFSRTYRHVRFGPLREYNTEATTSRTLQRTDAGNFVRFTSSSAVTCTIPNDTTLNFPIWTEITLIQFGSGIITMAGGSGVTIETPFGSDVTSMGIGSSIKLVKIGNDTWLAQVTYDRVIIGGIEHTGDYDQTGTTTINGRLNVDNLRADENTLSSTNNNGDINLDPNGSGEINLQADTNITGSLIISQDLTVQGTTTHIDSTVVDIGDNIIVLNAGETGSPTQDAGFEVERGTSPNVQWVWDESNDAWSGGNEKLRGIADPTNDNHVGDRGYNDGRYTRGPASATDNALVRFDGTTGKLVQNSDATLDDSGNLTVALSASSTAKDYNGTARRAGFEPQVIQVDSSRALTDADVGHTLLVTNSGVELTFNGLSGSSAAQHILIWNNTGADFSLIEGTGSIFWRIGDETNISGNFDVAGASAVVLFLRGSGSLYISGVGISEA